MCSCWEVLSEIQLKYILMPFHRRFMNSWFCVVSYLLLKMTFSFLVCLYNAYLGVYTAKVHFLLLLIFKVIILAHLY